MRFLQETQSEINIDMTQNAEKYEITESNIRNVTMAGLMHDLGHGPFSHLFDRDVIPYLWDLKNNNSYCQWQHEDASVMLFDHMIDYCNIDLEEDQMDKKLIKKLIKGDINL